MGKKGVINNIIDDIRNGVPREVLDAKYNKGSVTKAYRKLGSENNLEHKNIINKEIEFERLIKELLNLIDENDEYEIRININKKTVKIKDDKKQTNIKKEIENPFQLFYELGNAGYLLRLKSSKRDTLIEVIKRYFSLSKKELDKLSVDELANYIITETEKTLNIGLCFK